MAKKKFRGWTKLNAPRKLENLDRQATQQNRDFASSSWHASAPEEAEVFPPESVTVPSASPLSEAKLAANRANAQLSTGATSEAGKAAVSQNATKHGLTGKFNVHSNESQAAYDKLLAGFMRSESPAGDEEIEMVHQMTEAMWLSRRSLRLQDACFVALDAGTPEEQREAHKKLALYLRYQVAHDRSFYRCAAELRRRRSERARAARGFVSQQHKQAAEIRRHEIHTARQEYQKLRQDAQEIRNRTASAKAAALELKNQCQKSKTMAAA